MAARFAKICSVCSWIVPAWISLSPGRSASCPDTKTRSSKRIACKYVAPWNAARAHSVRTTDFSAIAAPLPWGPDGTRPARLRERDAQRLEDRQQHVLGLLALDQPHVQRQSRPA